MESREKKEKLIHKAFRILFTKGPGEFCKRTYRKIERPVYYHKWFMRHRATPEQLEEQSKHKFDYMPKISILVPVYNTPLDLLKEMIESCIGQSYQNWELCIADGSIGKRINADGSVVDATNILISPLEEILKSYHEMDSRVVYRILDENAGIAGNTNKALELATGDFIGLLDHDDFLEKDALYEVVKALQNGADIVYTDEDKLKSNGRRFFDPNFKPDFSIDLLRSHNYITHFYVVRADILRNVGAFDSAFDGAQDYDMMFRCIEASLGIEDGKLGHNAGKIVHIPRILYHWRMAKGSTADNPENKMYCYEAGRKSIANHLERLGVKATTTMTGLWGMYHTTYEVVGDPLVSIIIPNKDHTEDLDLCIRSVMKTSTYKNIEFIIVENNSTEDNTFLYYKNIEKEFSNVKVVYWKKEFNYSALNNFGAEFAKGDYYLFLNNDTELLTPEGISEMLGVCQRTDVGAVGAKLIYPDETVQHAGVVLGFRGYAQHVFLGIPRNDYGFMVRARINCNYNAVTGACLMTSREVYDEVGGFSEELPVAGNDVDFCLKIRQKDYLIVYDAFSEWHHFESKSRGYEDTPEKKARYASEMAKFREKWGNRIDAGDEYYNPNFPLDKAPYEL